MIKLGTRQDDSQSNSLNFIAYSKNKSKALYFDSLFFSLVDKGDLDLETFNKLYGNKKFLDVVEIRNEELLDIFYLRMNDDSLIQIGWMPMDNKLDQYLRIYDKGSSDTSYEEAMKRFLEAEPYEDIDLDDWK